MPFRIGKPQVKRTSRNTSLCDRNSTECGNVESMWNYFNMGTEPERKKRLKKSRKRITKSVNQRLIKSRKRRIMKTSSAKTKETVTKKEVAPKKVHVTITTEIKTNVISAINADRRNFISKALLPTKVC